MKHVLIVGGRGFVGSRISEILKAKTDWSIQTAGRSSENDVRLDLCDPTTFPILHTYDLIINASDNFQASPLALIQYALNNKLRLLECTADPITIQNAIDSAPESADGLVIVGVGLFPGLTNILLSEVSKKVDSLKSLSLEIFISPFSQAGKSTCRLMAEHFSYQTITIENSRRVIRETLEKPRNALGLRLYFPEVVMLEKSLQARNVETFLVPMPLLLVPLLSTFRALFQFAFLKPLNIFFLTLLRFFLFQKTASKILFAGVARGDDGQKQSFSFQTRDGLTGIAAGTYAMAVSVLESSALKGLLMPDQAVGSLESFMTHYFAVATNDSVEFSGG